MKQRAIELIKVLMDSNVSMNYYGYALRIKTRGTKDDICITNYEHKWFSRYIEENYFGIDPTVQYKYELAPLLWGVDFPLQDFSSQQQKLLRHACDYGIRNGVTVQYSDHLYDITLTIVHDIFHNSPNKLL